jgi:phosphate-selective porin OprO/OprP
MKNGLLLSASVLAMAVTTVAVANADAMKFTSKGLVLVSDGGFEAVLGGRLHLDAVSFDDDLTVFQDEVDWRRIRPALSLKLGDDISAKVEYEFRPGHKGWRSLWIAYDGIENVKITLGNQPTPFGLENSTSSNDTVFMERSLAYAFDNQFLLGGTIDYYGSGWTASAGVYKEGIEADDGVRNKGTSFVGRVTFAPVKDDSMTLHLGANVAYFDADSGGMSFSSRPEVGITEVNLVRTGGLADADSSLTFGLEAALAAGSFAVQGEYLWADVNRSLNEDPNFSGAYIQASYILTGEKYGYKRKGAVLGGVEPKSDWGAIEVGARYSTIDLEDSLVTGGEESNVTLGINWYPCNNFRLMANYVMVDASPNSVGLDESPSALEFRAQVAF